MEMAIIVESNYINENDYNISNSSSDDACSSIAEAELDLKCIEPRRELEPGHIEERFKVDRKKLERMLQVQVQNDVGDCPKLESGEDFFQRIMDETDTTISWPSRLKIGAKSKKDPHIKVTGKPERVAAAKSKIMSVLDTKSNRVTLKMDVSFMEHSHIIGKGGNNIRRVMEDTGCHIHFPDSNRCTQQEKSNQVSIAGQLVGAEQARAKIRELLPLMMFFDLPAGAGVTPPDMNSPTVQHIVQTYNVAVSMKQKARGYTTTVTVRGSASNPLGVNEACLRLMEHLTNNVGVSLPVSTQIEIAPQHHQFMLVRGGLNINYIMQCTRTTICFPEPSTAQRKSSVFISGDVSSAIVARELLMGCLPLVLMFDVRDDTDISPSNLTRIMEQYDVFISIKPKPKQPIKSVIIKSAERNAANMYRARQRLLGQECESSGETDKNSISSLPLPTVGMMPVLMHHGMSTVIVQSPTNYPFMFPQTGATMVQPNIAPISVPQPNVHSQHIPPAMNMVPPNTSQSPPTLVYNIPKNGPVVQQPSIPLQVVDLTTGGDALPQSALRSLPHSLYNVAQSELTQGYGPMHAAHGQASDYQGTFTMTHPPESYSEVVRHMPPTYPLPPTHDVPPRLIPPPHRLSSEQRAPYGMVTTASTRSSTQLIEYHQYSESVTAPNMSLRHPSQLDSPPSPYGSSQGARTMYGARAPSNTHSQGIPTSDHSQGDSCSSPRRIMENHPPGQIGHPNSAAGAMYGAMAPLNTHSQGIATSDRSEGNLCLPPGRIMENHPPGQIGHPTSGVMRMVHPLTSSSDARRMESTTNSVDHRYGPSVTAPSISLRHPSPLNGPSSPHGTLPLSETDPTHPSAMKHVPKGAIPVPGGMNMAYSTEQSYSAVDMTGGRMTDTSLATPQRGRDRTRFNSFRIDSNDGGGVANTRESPSSSSVTTDGRARELHYNEQLSAGSTTRWASSPPEAPPSKVPAPPPGFHTPNPAVVSSQLVQLRLSGAMNEKPKCSASAEVVFRASSTSDSSSPDASEVTHSVMRQKGIYQRSSNLSDQSISPDSSGHYSPSSSSQISPSDSGHFEPSNGSRNGLLHNGGSLYKRDDDALYGGQLTDRLARLLSDRGTRTQSQGSSESEVDSDNSDKRAPGWERTEKHRELIKLESDLMNLDYGQKKLLARKAMKNLPLTKEVRTPIDTWSGLGFSKSMPGSNVRSFFKKNGFSTCLPSTYENEPVEKNPADCWRHPENNNKISHAVSTDNHRQPRKQEFNPSCSNYIDSTTLRRPTNGLWSHPGSDPTPPADPDLSELFIDLGLGQYTDFFQQQDINLDTFLTLTDSDLRELGINTFGTRRRMLVAISDLNNNRQRALGTSMPQMGRTPTLVGGYRRDTGQIENQGRTNQVLCW